MDTSQHEDRKRVKMQIDHRFAPRDVQELKMVRAIEVASEILESLLNVEIVLQAQRQPGWAGADAFHSGMYVRETRMIKINFRNLVGHDAKTVLRVLGHEFRHAVQYQHGLMEAGGKWKGPEMDTINFQNSGRFSRYYNQPHEVDARMYETVYANMVISDPRFSDMLEDLNVPGEQMMRVDWDATYKSIGFTGTNDPEKGAFRLKDGRFAWLRLSEVYPGKNKWTKALIQRAFREHADLMQKNIFQAIKVPVTIDDLVS
jgi:hypothetical protein